MINSSLACENCQEMVVESTESPSSIDPLSNASYCCLCLLGFAGDDADGREGHNPSFLENDPQKTCFIEMKGT